MRRPDPRGQVETLESRPALGARGRAPVHRDRAFQDGSLRSHRTGVVAGVRLLLVGGVVLLVHDDEPEVGHRGEDGRAGADDDPRLPRPDALALVAPLGLGQRGVQHRDALAEACREAAQRLRRQGDLRHEHDRPAAAPERRRAGLEVDLGLAAARRAVQEDVAAGPVERRDDPCDRGPLRLGQLLGLRLAGQAVPERGRPALAAPRPCVRCDQRQCPRGRRPVVVGEPEREVHESRRNPVENVAGGRDVDALGRGHAGLDDDPAQPSATEPDRDDRAARDVLVDLVRERSRERAGGHERVHLGEGHDGERSRGSGDRPVARLRPWTPTQPV